MKFMGENSLTKLLNLIKTNFFSKEETQEFTTVDVPTQASDIGAVPTTRTIAGVDLVDNITKAEMLTALNVADGANAYTLPVAGSVLGGIKSGTDITVDASGNVSVNDDSHNHIVNNIDGLQSILDDKAASSHTHSQYLTQHQSLSAYRTASAQDTIDTAKQDKTDNTLSTTSKTVVGAINELNSVMPNVTEYTAVEVDALFDSI